MSTDEKTSPLVNQQLPQFVIDEGPQLIEFIKAYYEYAEQANNALEVSKNLKIYQDYLFDFIQISHLDCSYFH